MLSSNSKFRRSKKSIRREKKKTGRGRLELLKRKLKTGLKDNQLLRQLTNGQEIRQKLKKDLRGKIILEEISLVAETVSIGALIESLGMMMTIQDWASVTTIQQLRGKMVNKEVVGHQDSQTAKGQKEILVLA